MNIFLHFFNRILALSALLACFACTNSKQKCHLDELEATAVKLLYDKHPDSIQKALNCLNLILEQDEAHHYDAYRNKAIILTRLHRYHDALDAFKNYHRAKNEFEKADFDGVLYFAYGKQHELIGDTTSAKHFYQKSINLLKDKSEQSMHIEDILNYLVSFRQIHSYQETTEKLDSLCKDIETPVRDKEDESWIAEFRENIKDRNFPYKDLLE